MSNINYFRVTDKLLIPENFEELEKKIADAKLRVKDTDALRGIVEKAAGGKIDRKAAEKEIRNLLEYIPIDEQVERCLTSQPIPEQWQRLLAFIYNTMTGNYCDGISPRELHYWPGRYEIVISDKAVLEDVFGTSDSKEICNITNGLSSVFKVEAETEGHWASGGGFCHMEMEGDIPKLTIGIDKLMIVLLPKYIHKMVKAEYIKPMSAETILFNRENYIGKGKIQHEKLNYGPKYVVTISSDYVRMLCRKRRAESHEEKVAIIREVTEEVAGLIPRDGSNEMLTRFFHDFDGNLFCNDYGQPIVSWDLTVIGKFSDPNKAVIAYESGEVLCYVDL